MTWSATTLLPTGSLQSAAAGAADIKAAVTAIVRTRRFTSHSSSRWPSDSIRDDRRAKAHRHVNRGVDGAAWNYRRGNNVSALRHGVAFAYDGPGALRSSAATSSDEKRSRLRPGSLAAAGLPLDRLGRRSFRTASQDFAPSLSCHQIPSASRSPSQVTPTAR